MTVLIVYDNPEEAAAGVLLGYNSIKLAERAPRISSGGIIAELKRAISALIHYHSR